MQALDDIVVLDLTQHIAGPYATKLLGDLGAEVIKVEPPGGDIARRLPPFAGDEPHPERSGLFAYLNTNKRSVVLDLGTPDGLDSLRRLAERADVVVESFPPGTLDRLGCGWPFFQAVRPSLPLVSISDFGQDGPYRDFAASELVTYGFGGEMYSMGLTEREPVKMAGTAALFESGSAAAVAVLAAVFAARRSGIGQHIDVSLVETHLGGVDRRHATAIAFQFSGRRALRAAGAGGGMPQGIYPCADGYVEFTGAALYPDRVLDMIGEEWARDSRYLDPMNRVNPEIIDEWNAQFFAWCLERTKRQIWAEARRARVLCGPLFTMEDLFADEHFRDRGFWQTVEHPVIGSFEMPGRPFIMAAGGWKLHRPAPLLGQDTDAVFGGAENSPHPPTPSPNPGRGGATPARSSVHGRPTGGPGDGPRETVTPGTPLPGLGEGSGVRAFAGSTRMLSGAPAPGPRLPLAGVRIVDLCVVWAGPFATMLLGDLGAEVIKPENPFVFQPMTRGAMARPPQALLAAAASWGGGYPGNVAGARPWNYNPTFVSLYRNKKSFTVDLRRPEGLEVLRQLVARSDVVYENNATGTVEKLGITYDWLRQAREDIIFVRVPAYGSTGPYKDARALGVHLEAVMGHTLLRGYADADPTANTAIYSGDYLAGTQGALAVMAALWHRERTGEGQLIEISQAENAAAMFTQALMDYSLNRRVQGAIGNRDVFGQYPCGVYPCLSPGTAATMEDRWISIHVQSDDEWAGLRRAMGGLDWAEDPRFATNDGRAAHAAEIDGRIAAWTAGLEDYEVMHRCQAQRVAAAPVLEASRIFDDPHLRARGFFRRQRQADAGEYEYVGPLWRFPATPVEFYQPPVMFGEHNDYVYRDVLGLSEEEIDRLAAAGHIATEYDASVP
jgi:crotonobetainyl-CoA:carnitine CoA-transferase CaiB-like acyl-CoA transferase